ncbi:MAG: hypothetical protein CM15mP47_3630 [Methanobacteriota archaeon]|nr:MAG: hypothetical protein CM15mP47_3630 [Euryarchaeota archaeon]
MVGIVFVDSQSIRSKTHDLQSQRLASRHFLKWLGHRWPEHNPKGQNPGKKGCQKPLSVGN